MTATPPVAATQPEAAVQGYAELSGAFSKCTSCHSSELTTPTDRQAAPLGYDYNIYELATQHLEVTRDVVAAGNQPPPGSPQLTAQEKTDMLLWIDCDAPM